MLTVTPAMKVQSGAMTQPASDDSASTPDSQMQRLKVEDALGYLDMVKIKFGHKPQVYNDFLDIMKEFKSQSIDTPGVIDRVSNLFNGHPELIQGFNTFLPPGYRIEVKSNEQGYSFQVQVSMPSPSTACTTIVSASPLIHHNTQLPTAHTKSLLLAGTTTVTYGNTASAMVPLPPPMPATTSPHLPPHAYTTTITPVQMHPAVPRALSPVENTPSSTPQNQSQPVEFNHAINYVNKIKNRFQGQPYKYKQFLEILNTYQKEQRVVKEGAGSGSQCLGPKQLTEAEVYSQVAKLFEHQEDLLAEFGEFLPDATNHHTQLTRQCEDPSSVNRKSAVNVKTGSGFIGNTVVSPNPVSVSGTSVLAKMCDASASTDTLPEAAAPRALKRSPSPSPSTSHQPNTALPAKKQKLAFSFRDVSFAEAAEYGTLTDFAFFDKVRKALRTQDVYDNFLRCVSLYIIEVVNRYELMQLVTPFLSRFPELFRWFREFIGQPESQPAHSPEHSSMSSESTMNSNHPGGDQFEIDLASCKRFGASYCALPSHLAGEKCSGRTSLCHQVLNDTWISVPAWSEESTFVTSPPRKTQYEEYIFRCEDERFELDMVLEVNAATIRVLDTVYKKLCHMSDDDVAKFRFDEHTSLISPTTYQRAIARVYGDKSPEIIDGIKKNPLISIPIVVKRLKSKDEEWREAQKAFNKVWREQNEKYYLKSLDHQGINLKQNDMKALRSKSETGCDEANE